MSGDIFSRLESGVRSYSRSFPAVFRSASGPFLYAEGGRRYIDFLAGAGALNYGHNHPALRGALVEYLAGDGVTHLLDIHTTALREFLAALDEVVLRPGGLDHRVQYCGPTGSNAVEAGIKLARKVTGRSGVFSFTGAYHGVTGASLAVTAGAARRRAAGAPPDWVTFFPYPAGPHSPPGGLDALEAALGDPMSGVGVPAAVVVEPVQAEGGVYEAPVAWLRGLRELCTAHDILLLCDEVQTGCGRTGPFFAFQRAGVIPDLVTVSKSIGGYGLPLSLLLVRPHLDAWSPGEHNGTFRANQLALVAGAAALRLRTALDLEAAVGRHERWLRDWLPRAARAVHPGLEVRGVGLLWGVDLTRCGGGPAAADASRRCFDAGLVVERVGRGDAVLKILPPLTIPPEVLEEGCRILLAATAAALAT